MFLELAATIVVTALPTQPLGTHTQIYSTDCAIAALQDSLHAYGIDETQPVLAADADWQQDAGTNLSNLAGVYQDYVGYVDQVYAPNGLTAPDLRELAEDNVPVMITVNANLLPWYSYAKDYATPTWHEIVLDGTSGHKLMVFDVAEGWHAIGAKVLARADVADAIWHP